MIDKQIKIPVREAAIVAFGWLFFSSILVATFGEVAHLNWLIFLWVLATLNIAALGKTVAKVLDLVSDTARKPNTGSKLSKGIELFFWVLVKLSVLGLTGWLVFKFLNKIPALAIYLGIGTWAIVPLLGGWIWSKKVNAS